MSKILIASAIFSACLIQSAHASPDSDYLCTIEREPMLEHQDYVADLMIKATVGKQFTVNRSTGVITGALINSTNSTLPTVVDHGNNKNPFKTVTVSKLIDSPGSTLFVLVINESKNKKMSFSYLDGIDVTLGSCVHWN